MLLLFPVCKVDTMHFPILKFSSDSATYPDVEYDILSWESFLSTVREEIESKKVSGKMSWLYWGHGGSSSQETTVST